MSAPFQLNPVPRLKKCKKPDPERLNYKRAKWALAAVKAFMQETGSDFEDAISDLLADMRHLSDRNPLNVTFERELERAGHHYEAETMNKRA